MNSYATSACHTCRHWCGSFEPNLISPQFGTCRRFPPVTFDPDEEQIVWASTEAKDWCGEWTGKTDSTRTGGIHHLLRCQEDAGGEESQPE